MVYNTYIEMKLVVPEMSLWWQESRKPTCCSWNEVNQTFRTDTINIKFIPQGSYVIIQFLCYSAFKRSSSIMVYKVFILNHIYANNIIQDTRSMETASRYFRCKLHTDLYEIECIIQYSNRGRGSNNWGFLNLRIVVKYS